MEKLQVVCWYSTELLAWEGKRHTISSASRLGLLTFIFILFWWRAKLLELLPHNCHHLSQSLFPSNKYCRQLFRCRCHALKSSAVLMCTYYMYAYMHMHLYIHVLCAYSTWIYAVCINYVLNSYQYILCVIYIYTVYAQRERERLDERETRRSQASFFPSFGASSVTTRNGMVCCLAKNDTGLWGDQKSMKSWTKSGILGF